MGLFFLNVSIADGNFYHHYYFGMLNLGDTKAESFARHVKKFFYYLLYFSHSYQKLHRTSYMSSVNK